MSSEEIHVALPKLYGAPAYARPSRPVDAVARPVDPDDLPLELQRTPEEHEFASRIVGDLFTPILSAPPGGAGGEGQIEAKPFRLRGLTSKLFRNS